MSEKNAPSDDKAESKERLKRDLGNPRERQRSFMRQRAAILRPHDDMGGETNTQPSAEQEGAEAEQDDAAKPRAHDERRKLLAQYRRRQREK